MEVMAHAHTAEAVALNTMILYPPVLFLVFALSAGIHSVRAARAREELVSSDATGPGGHGLPLKTRQRARSAASVVPEFSKTIRYIFYCASFLVVLSFLTNIIVILVHVVGTASQDGWWSGDEIAVRCGTPVSPLRLLNYSPPRRSTSWAAVLCIYMCSSASRRETAAPASSSSSSGSCPSREKASFSCRACSAPTGPTAR